MFPPHSGTSAYPAVHSWRGRSVGSWSELDKIPISTEHEVWLFQVHKVSGIEHSTPDLCSWPVVTFDAELCWPARGRTGENETHSSYLRRLRVLL
jgi:hypothetical protein